MEKYLKGEVKQKAAEERMLNAYLLDDGLAPEEDTKAPD
jgi:hypothetical protein